MELLSHGTAHQEMWGRDFATDPLRRGMWARLTRLSSPPLVFGQNMHASDVLFCMLQSFDMD